MKSRLKQILPACVTRLVKRLLAIAGHEPKFLKLRRPGYALLRGEGMEIGAFEHPAALPSRCRVRYADVITPEQAAQLFPEVDASRLVPLDHVIDIDRVGLGPIEGGTMDFVIACHVIEHVANPGRLVAEMTRVVKRGGCLVIAAPDRDYTFDRLRPVTPTDRLEQYFRQGRAPVTPEDYREIIECVHTELLQASAGAVEERLRDFHRRREHLSVWTAAGFRDFLVAAYGWSEVKMEPLYEVMPDRNRFEYFGVWRRVS